MKTLFVFFFAAVGSSADDASLSAAAAIASTRVDLRRSDALGDAVLATPRRDAFDLREHADLLVLPNVGGKLPLKGLQVLVGRVRREDRVLQLAEAGLSVRDIVETGLAAFGSEAPGVARPVQGVTG